MRLPPPTKKNETTLNTIMEMLPNKSQASRQIALMYVLSQFAVDEVSFISRRTYVQLVFFIIPFFPFSFVDRMT